jgi:thiamine transport system substrate-binding protein
MKKTILVLLASFIVLIASDKPTLTIYTYDAFAASWGPGPKVKEAFEKKCNCNLKIVGVSSSISTLRKIQLEGKKTKADIILGLDTAIAQVAKDTNLFIPHGLNTSSISLPISYNDNTFVPFDYSYFAFVYDETKLKNPPKSFDALASMPEDFKIVIQDPRSSTPGLGLLLWVKSLYGDKASEYWKSLSPHILSITKGWSEAYELFLKGEADMVLSYTTSPAYHMIAENKYNIKAVNFTNGHYGQVEVAAIVKYSKQKELAKKFLEFLYSKEFANIIPTTNWAYPVLKNIKLHKDFDKLIKPKTMKIMDGKEVQENRKAIINEWLEAVKK